MPQQSPLWTILTFQSFLLRKLILLSLRLPFPIPLYPSSNAETGITHTTPHAGAPAAAEKWYPLPSSHYLSEDSHHFPGSLAATAHWAQVSREHSMVTPSTFSWLVAASCEFTTMWAWFRFFYPRHHLTLCTLKLICHLSASFLFLARSFCLLYNFSTQPLLHVRNFFDAISIQSPQKPLVRYFVLMLPEDPHHLYLQPYSVTLSKSWWALDVASSLKMYPISAPNM